MDILKLVIKVQYRALNELIGACLTEDPQKIRRAVFKARGYLTSDYEHSYYES